MKLSGLFLPNPIDKYRHEWPIGSTISWRSSINFRPLTIMIAGYIEHGCNAGCRHCACEGKVVKASGGRTYCMGMKVPYDGWWEKT